MITAMKATILLLIAFLAIESVRADFDCENGFENYKKAHGKKYKDAKEHQKRKDKFKTKCLKINEHNKRFKAGLETYQKGINRFTDMEPEELRKFTGVRVPAQPTTQANQVSGSGNVKVKRAVTIPSSLDYRSSGCITPVKDQGQCGSCWAFSTTGALEYKQCNKSKIAVRLSEQNLVDCDLNNKGCSGGWPPYAIKYVVGNNKKLSTEASYSYTAEDWSSCEFTTSSNGLSLSTLSYGSVLSGSASDMINKLVTYGPIITTIDVEDDFYSYTSGVFKSQNCNNPTNHAVLLVGYGNDKTLGSYWLVKNSWSNYWGEQGYIRISNTTNMCGILNYGWYLVAS